MPEEKSNENYKKLEMESGREATELKESALPEISVSDKKPFVLPATKEQLEANRKFE